MNQKIRDEAREKIALEYLAKEYGLSVDAIKLCIERDKIRKNHIADAYKLADQILSLSGETDEVCDHTLDAGKRVYCVPDSCPNCKGTSTIKKKWYIKVEVEEC